MRFIHALGIIVVASPLLASATTTQVEPPVAKSVPQRGGVLRQRGDSGLHARLPYKPLGNRISSSTINA